MSAVVIAIASQKGGVGKTTTAVNLAAALARQSFSVLLADMDAQAGASRNLINDYGPRGKVVYNVLLGTCPITNALLRTSARFDLLPSDLELAGIDAELAGKPNPDGRLSLALRDVSERYHVVLVDCPGWIGQAMLNGLTAADYVLVPIDCKAQALEAVPRLTGLVKETAEAYRRSIGMLALPTFFEGTNMARDVLEAIRLEFESATLTPIHKNTKLAEAYARRRTIFEHDPTSPGAVDYMRTAKEIADATLPQRTRARRESGTAAE